MIRMQFEWLPRRWSYRAVDIMHYLTPVFPDLTKAESINVVTDFR